MARHNRQTRGRWRARWAHREWGLVLLILLLTITVGCVEPGFLSIQNWRDILVRCAPTVIVACGVMLVVVTAEIDISVGSLMALIAAVMGRLISTHEWGWHPLVGIPLCLLLGMLIGMTTGCLVTLGRVPSIIVTLGMMTALRGATTWMMGGRNIDGLPETWSRWCKQGFAGVPLGVWVAAATAGVTWVLIHRTPLGCRLFAIGSSRQAARTAGLPERRLKIWVFTYTGLLTAVATVVDVPRLPKIEAGIGSEFELLVVTCVVVGGVSIAGGRGKLAGVLPAVVLMTMVRPVLTFLNVGESGEKWTKAIQGLFILLALLGDRAWDRTNQGTETSPA